MESGAADDRVERRGSSVWHLLVGLVLGLVVIIGAALGGGGLYLALAPSPIDVVVVMVASPDDAFALRRVRHDNGAGFGLGDEWGEVQLVRRGRWLGDEIVTVLRFRLEFSDGHDIRLGWTDAEHGVVTLPPAMRAEIQAFPAGRPSITIVTAP